MDDHFTSQMVFGIVITAVLLIILFALVFSTYLDNRKRSVKKGKEKLLNSFDAGGSKTAPTKPLGSDPNAIEAEAVDAGIPLELVEIDSDITKVLRLVGIADCFDSTTVLNDILDEKFEKAALAIASKLSFRQPLIRVSRQSQKKTLDNGGFVVADVKISGREPMFGTIEFDYQVIDINVYPGASAYPDKFVFAIAHELCHKILHSLERGRGNNTQDERETDVAAALLGFRKNLERVKSLDHGFGYLERDEVNYLVRKCNDLLRKIHANMTISYKEYVLLRQKNEEKVLLLDNLLKAKQIIGDNDFLLDYSRLGEDYNKLIVCANVISYKRLREYKKLVDFFSSLNKVRDRYSLDLLKAEDKMVNLRAILDELSLPEFNAVDVLKKYQ